MADPFGLWRTMSIIRICEKPSNHVCPIAILVGVRRATIAYDNCTFTTEGAVVADLESVASGDEDE
jgi:hypothetical protein